MRLVKYLTLVFFSINLIACSYVQRVSFLQSRGDAYLKAKSIPPLRIPPGYSSEDFQNYYPIPDRNYPEKAKKLNLAPPGLYN